MVTDNAIETGGDGGGFSCNRRELLAGALGAPLVACLPSGVMALPLAKPGPHLAFIDDRPQLDPSGTLPRYHPPAGHHGGAALAGLDEERLRYLMPFMT